MIRCPYQDHMRREPIYLEQKSGDNSLDLACFMLVSTLLRDGIELIEKQDAPTSSHELKSTI